MILFLKIVGSIFNEISFSITKISSQLLRCAYSPRNSPKCVYSLKWIQYEKGLKPRASMEVDVFKTRGSVWDSLLAHDTELFIIYLSPKSLHMARALYATKGCCGGRGMYVLRKSGRFKEPSFPSACAGSESEWVSEWVTQTHSHREQVEKLTNRLCVQCSGALICFLPAAAALAATTAARAIFCRGRFYCVTPVLYVLQNVVYAAVSPQPL
jgi:hypothetical protein